jgi:hypothetical protein
MKWLDFLSKFTASSALGAIRGPIARRGLMFALVGATCALCVLAVRLPGVSSSGSVPKHVLTWAYDGEYGGLTDGAKATGTNAAAKRHAQTWLSFAEAGIQANGLPQKAYYDCNAGAPCKNVVYYNPFVLYSTCWPHMQFLAENTSEDFYLHDSGPPSLSNRTTRTKRACKGIATVYYANGNNPAVGQWFARNLLWIIPENTNTVMFQDESTVSCRGRFHVGERYTPLELQRRDRCEDAMIDAIRNTANQIRWKDGTPVPSIVNAFGVHPNDIAYADAVPLVAPGSQIIGGVEEAGEISGTRYTPHVVFADVNTASMVYAANPNAYYVFLSNGHATPGSTQTCEDSVRNTEDSCGALQLRRDALGSFWLAYKEGNTVLWENFNSAGNPCCGGKTVLAVYPEASIYPSSPVQALRPFNPNVATTDGSGCGAARGSGGIASFVVACGTLNDGITPAGVYVREFRECYNFGQLIGTGQCAVVMNTTNRSVTIGNWFTQGYTNLMTLGSGPTDGGDVLTAGCDNARCPTSAMYPLGAPFVLGSTQVPAFDATYVFHR